MRWGPLIATDLLAKRVLARCELDSYYNVSQSVTLIIMMSVSGTAVVVDAVISSLLRLKVHSKIQRDMFVNE